MSFSWNTPNDILKHRDTDTQDAMATLIIEAFRAALIKAVPPTPGARVKMPKDSSLKPL